MDSELAAGATETEIFRARRYEIGTHIRFRVRGGREWHEGMTENISISGVLIRTNQPLEPNTAIEMKFFLPVELDGECAAEVFCRGCVVRSSRCRVPVGTYTIAARIIHSRFLRQTGRNEDIGKDSSNGNPRLSL